MSSPVLKRISTLPKYIIAFHGCSEKDYDEIIRTNHFVVSTNDYDWLGPGVYFWENNYTRAYEWALEQMKSERKAHMTPKVIGAVIKTDGNWIDFLDEISIKKLKEAYSDLKKTFKQLKKNYNPNFETPKNAGILRKLDCAVIRRLLTKCENEEGKIIDATRGAFVEGKKAYPSANFFEKTHIQIAVLNQKCIVEIFDPKNLEEVCKAYKHKYT